MNIDTPDKKTNLYHPYLSAFGLTESEIALILENAKTFNKINAVLHFIKYILPRNIPIAPAIRIVLYNHKFFEKFDLNEHSLKEF